MQNLVQSFANALGKPSAEKRGAPIDMPLVQPDGQIVAPGQAGAAPVSSTAGKNAVPVQAVKDLSPATPITLHPDILGTVGEEIAHDLSQVLEVIVQSASSPRTLGQGLSRSHFLIDRLRSKAMSMQQIARLAQNRVRQSHEKLSLAQVVQQVLDDRKAQYAASGLVVETRFKAVDIIVDPGLLVNLISVAIDWVSEFGVVVHMSTSMKNWPQHGQLTLVAAQGIRTQEDIDRKTEVNQSIAWHLMQQVAQTMGVGMVMDETVHERSLTIEFPRTVVALEGMTIIEMNTAAADQSNSSSFGTVNSNFVAGHTVLVLAQDYRLYVQVRDICKGLSLRCEHAPNIDVAERHCEQQVPDLIVCEEALDDDQYDALLVDLQRHIPGFPTIIVSEGGYGFEFSDWSGNSKSRVSRSHIAEQLPGALTVELSRII